MGFESSSPAPGDTTSAGSEYRLASLKGVVFSLTRRLNIASGVGAIIVFFFTWFFRGETSNAQANQLTFTVAFLLSLVASGVTMFYFGRRLVLGSCRCVTEGREPTRNERDSIARLPLRLARMVFVLWLIGVVVFTLLNLAYGGTTHVVLVPVTIFFGGLTTASLSYLLSEDALRPVFVVAFRAAPPPKETTIGVRPRLLLFWMLESALPLFAIGLVLLWSALIDQATNTAAIIFVVGVGLVTGLTNAFVVARSISRPIDGVRDAISEVTEGNLETRVGVDDGGDIGRLQAQVNEMIDGLRERDRLHDLFGKHVGLDVASHALADDDELGGQELVVSTLFIDVTGFTSLTQTRPAHAVVTIMNAIFQVVVDTVRDAGGHVNKFEGDAALCIFGAPTELHDHAAAALSAAVSLRDSLAALYRGSEAVDVGIGVATGLVVAGNVGARERYEYTVIGDAVNEAARLCELAKSRPSRLLASDKTLDAAGLVGDSVTPGWLDAGEIELRGRSEPSHVWESQSSWKYPSASSLTSP